MKMERAFLHAAVSTGRVSAAFFEPKVHACERYVVHREKVAAGDPASKLCLAVRGLEIGKIDVAEFSNAIRDLDLTPERAQKVAQVRANAICEARVNETRAAGMDAEVQKAATRELLKLYEAGTHPDSDSSDIYWWMIGTYAKEQGDKAMMRRALEGLEKIGDRSRFGPLMDELKAATKR